MDIKTARSRGVELATKLPWQEIADSPTIRYYTDWSKFEGFKGLEKPQRVPTSASKCEVVVLNGALANHGVCEGVEIGVGGEVFRHLQINSKILALHASVLHEAVYVRIRGRVEPLIIKLAAFERGFHIASHVHSLPCGAPRSHRGRCGKNVQCENSR